MNGLFNLITKAIQEIQISGVAPFITSADKGGSPFSYGKAAFVSLGRVVYQSLIAGNTTTPPGANWSAVPEKIQPLDATLTALAGLVGTANKLPYFNGDETAAMTDLTLVGRDIIGMGTIASVLSYLGVSYTISEPDTSTVIYTLPGGYKLMAFNRTVNNSSTVGTGVMTPVTFPQAFSARVIAVFATKRNYVQAAVSCENQTLTGFDAAVTLITTIAAGVTTTQAMFIAIGK